MTGDRKSQSKLLAESNQLTNFDDAQRQLASFPARQNSSTNALREKVSMLREQAVVNMKAA